MGLCLKQELIDDLKANHPFYNRFLEVIINTNKEYMNEYKYILDDAEIIMLTCSACLTIRRIYDWAQKKDITDSLVHGLTVDAIIGKNVINGFKELEEDIPKSFIIVNEEDTKPEGTKENPIWKYYPMLFYSNSNKVFCRDWSE